MSTIDETRITAALREVLTQELGPQADLPVEPAMAQALLVAAPGRDSAQPHEVPLDAVLHKIVLVRDRLRLIEQTVNSAAGLSDLEKIGLELRLTRVQDALVAFAASLLR